MKNTIILVHGVSISPKCMDPMAGYLRRHGWNVLRPAFLPANGSVPIEALAGRLSDYIATNTRPGERIDLVGFSMGGLVCRNYLQYLGGAARTDRFISIATPHAGTRVANWLPGAGMKQMRPGSAFLKELQQTAERLRPVACTAIYSDSDGIVAPASSAAVLPGARSIRMRLIPGHPLLLYHRKVHKKLAEILSAAQEPPR